jgi:hypothetical protein
MRDNTSIHSEIYTLNYIENPIYIDRNDLHLAGSAAEYTVDANLIKYRCSASGRGAQTDTSGGWFRNVPADDMESLDCGKLVKS